MTVPRRWLAFACVLAACAPDAPPPAEVWHLTAIGGLSVAPGVTLFLLDDGQLSGQGPCNRFSGTYAGPPPAFRPQAISATELACPRLEEESRFFAALTAATRAETSGDDLVLTGSGAPLRFRRGG